MSAQPAEKPRTRSREAQRVEFDNTLAQRMGDRALFCGATSEAKRAEILRAAIAAKGCADEVVLRPPSGPITWAEAFERRFREKL